MVTMPQGIPMHNGLSPMTATAGAMRFNTTANAMEMYDGTRWLPVMSDGRSSTKWLVVNTKADKLEAPPAGHSMVDVDQEVMNWIRTQPIHMWKWADMPAYSGHMDRLLMNDKLVTWMKLKYES